MSVLLVLPFPPSTNRIWRRVGTKTLLSREGRAYRQECAWRIALQRVQGFGAARISMDIQAHMPDSRRRDLDNLLKSAQDALQAARLFEDDSQIVDLRIRRAGVDRESPRLEIVLGLA